MDDETFEIFNCACVLSDYKDIIEIPYTGGSFPTMTEKAADRIMTVVKNLEYVLNPDLTLCEDFRRTLESVLGERGFDTVNIDDWKKVAYRYGEWLPNGLTEAWNTAYYNIISRGPS